MDHVIAIYTMSLLPWPFVIKVFIMGVMSGVLKCGTVSFQKCALLVCFFVSPLSPIASDSSALSDEFDYVMQWIFFFFLQKKQKTTKQQKKTTKNQNNKNFNKHFLLFKYFYCSMFFFCLFSGCCSFSSFWSASSGVDCSLMKNMFYWFIFFFDWFTLKK